VAGAAGTIDAVPSTSSLPIGVRGVPSSTTTPLIPAIMDASPLANQPDMHTSTPPSPPGAPASKADIVTPTRRSGRHGAATDGASATDEDSMRKAMPKKAELNLDYTWSQLHRSEDHDLFTEVCTRLEDTARDLYSRYGWQHNLRIGPPPT
jgi:hypothetical protein